jgi:RNA polymerase-binding protein DksA
MANLTDRQIGKLKETMLERQRLLTEEVSAQRAQAAEEGNDDAIGGPGDAGDESVVRMATDLHLQEAGRDLEEMRAIDGALTRIADGSYGRCDECGIEIDYARLEAQPAALRCVECQTQFEKTHAHGETPTL